MKIEKESLSTTITDKERTEAVKDKYGVSYTKDWKKLIRAPEQLTSYTIKEGTKVIGDRAFEYCDSLEYVNIPNSVTSIGDRAFSGCKSLESINIPNSVTSIGDSAFEWCDSLKSINIPNSVTSIGSSAFTWCESLESIYIPKGTKEKFSEMLFVHTGYLVENDI